MHWGAMMNDPPIEAADVQARELALDPARSMLLQAPAGSGKTTVLTQRFLRLLAEVDEPEQILAITFTRKAAAEMLTRVVEALAWEAAPGKADQQRSYELAQRAIARSQERGWNLPQSPSRLRIQTIDGLCHRLAASLPVGSRAGSALQIDERPDDTYSVAARRTLQDAERDPTLQPYAELLFTRLGNDWNRLERLLAEMLPRGCWPRCCVRGTIGYGISPQINSHNFGRASRPRWVSSPLRRWRASTARSAQTVCARARASSVLPLSVWARPLGRGSTQPNRDSKHGSRHGKVLQAWY